jgi:hypothetical protein
VKALFKGLSATLAAIPGLAIIVTGLGTPPGMKALFGGIIEAFGGLTLLLVYTQRKRIDQWSARRIMRVGATLGAVALAALLVYIAAISTAVAGDDQRGKVYVPLIAIGDSLGDLFSVAGGRTAAVDKYGVAAVQEAVNLAPWYALPLTTAALVLLYQMLFASLSAAFGVLASTKSPTE